MATVTVNDASLSAIAGAIREKLDVETTYKPSEMAAAIGSIQTGGADLTSADAGKVVVESSGEYVLQAQTSRSISQNGTYDTTTNSSVVVSVSGGGGSTNVLSGGSAPTSADGSNGDIWIYYTTAYINLTGGAYLETGIVPSTDWRLEVVAYIPDRNTALSKGRWPAFWSIDNSSDAFYCIQNMYQDRSGIIEYAAGGSSKLSQSGVYKYQETNRVSMRNHSLYVGETLIGTSGSGGSQASNHLILFGGNVEYKEKFTGRIYSAKMWDSNDTLVMSLVPDSSGGMLDLVSGNVFPFTGSGNSYVSGDAGVIQSIYLKVNGTWVDIIGQSISDVNLGS